MNAHSVGTNRRGRLALWLMFAALCASSPMAAQQADAIVRDTATPPTSADQLKQFEPPDGEPYTIGDGDQIEILVVGRAELSGSHLVGPDGRITLPVSGSLEIRNMTREVAAQKISESFQRYYTNADVTVRIAKYGSNRILVLGRVGEPGVLYFDQAPTLLDALTKSRAIAMGDPTQHSSIPRRCAIFRGKDQVVWIDLKAMLDSGAAGADIKLRRDDVVYVPDEQDDQLSVLGEVQHPGMVRLESSTTLAEVLARAGGLTNGAGSAKIQIVRPGSKVTQEISFNDLMNPKKNIEVSLRHGDVIYVQKGGLAKFEYHLSQVAPMGTLMVFGTTISTLAK
jgi:polysaccharide biosynthesis/export protein